MGIEPYPEEIRSELHELNCLWQTFINQQELNECEYNEVVNASEAAWKNILAEIKVNKNQLTKLIEKIKSHT
jgi:tellurite resistance protein